MKCCCFVLACVCVILLAGCSEIEPDDPLYVYGIGIDGNQAGISISVLTAKKSGKNSASGNAGSGGAGEDQTETTDILVYGGKNVKSAFDSFFEQNKDVFTGTNKKYIVGAEVPEDAVYDFKVYLTDSSKLPVKKEIVFKGNAYDYLEQNKEEFTE